MATTNMTEGNIHKHLIRYSIPLILGNLFQLTYNAVDSIIVGRFIGKEALAAEGTSNPIMNIMILGISGICMGASVLMSEFYGAKEFSKIKKELSTISIFGLIFSLFAALLGALCAKTLLLLLQVPTEILDLATTYLALIFLGLPFTYFYNAISAALRSVGDSKTPLRFLAFASILNALLDLILIGGFRFGIVCSALTTVFSQAVSALLCICYIYKKVPLLQLQAEDFKLDKNLLKQTLQYGSVTALQQSCQPIGKLLIQGTINPLGVDMIAAFNAVGRIDDYAFTPEQSISHGITTFVAQNRGAKKPERIRSGFRRGLLLEFCYWILIYGVITYFRTPLMELFLSDNNVSAVNLGSSYLALMAIFYILPAFTNGIQGFFRGMGNMPITLLGTFIQTSLRVLFVYLFVPSMGMTGVAYACAIGWAIMLLVEVPYYFIKYRRLL